MTTPFAAPISARPAPRRLGLAVALGLIVIGCGGGPATTGSATSSPSAVPSAAPTSSSTVAPTSVAPSASAAEAPGAVERPTDLPTDGSCEAGHDCLGLLDTGKYHSDVFEQGFGFTMAAGGWQNREDVAWTFRLLPIDHPGDAVIFFRDPRASSDFSTVVPSVDADVPAIVDWFTANPALQVSAPVDVTVGGLAGSRFDVAIDPDAANGDPTCPVRTCQSMLIGDADSGGPWAWGLAGLEKDQVYLLKRGTGTVAIIVDSLDGASFEDLTARASTILKTVTFD